MGLPPAPTESIGCVPHDDHWHCEGPATGVSASAASVVSTSASLPPSPTASVGCEPHGDHWHCDGPATAAGAASNTAEESAAAATFTGAADRMAAGGVAGAV